MPLLDLWRQNPDTVIKFTIEQMVTMAGDGDLRDESVCSSELRGVLAELKSQRLFEHIETCLSRAFAKSGAVLQDLVNELGRRLDYHVDNGLYSGRTNQIGFDGIWRGSDGHALVIEVKTTDAYRINLDTIAGYRNGLITAGRISLGSSALIIVGRNDTGDVEAQVRGSKHAWDIRLISIDALQKLVELKERADEDETVRKIQSLLKPFEYTRLDNIIDVMFATATDVEGRADEIEAELEAPETVRDLRQEHTPSHAVTALRVRMVDAMARQLGANLIARSRDGSNLLLGLKAAREWQLLVCLSPSLGRLSEARFAGVPCAWLRWIE